MESGQHTSKSISAQQIYPYKFGTPYKLGISVLPLVYFFLPLLELQNQVLTIPMPIPNAIYRIKSSSVDLNFPRQHRLLLEDNFIRVEIFMLPFLGSGCNKMVFFHSGPGKAAFSSFIFSQQKSLTLRFNLHQA